MTYLMKRKTLYPICIDASNGELSTKEIKKSQHHVIKKKLSTQAILDKNFKIVPLSNLSQKNPFKKCI